MVVSSLQEIEKIRSTHLCLAIFSSPYKTSCEEAVFQVSLLISPPYLATIVDRRKIEFPRGLATISIITGDVRGGVVARRDGCNSPLRYAGTVTHTGSLSLSSALRTPPLLPCVGFAKKNPRGRKTVDKILLSPANACPRRHMRARARVLRVYWLNWLGSWVTRLIEVR